MRNYQVEKKLLILFLTITVICVLYEPQLLAQSGLEGRINETIDNLVRIINILIVGFVAWAGFLIAKGDSSGMNRLIYGVLGLVVVNAAYMIINYFS